MEKIDFEIPEFGITGSAQAFDLKSMSRYIDEGAVPGASVGDTNERLMMRHLVSLEVDGKSDDDTMEIARKRCGALPGLVADGLAEAAGLPVKAPEAKQADALEDPMPPFLIAKVGLTAEKVIELLGAYPDVPQRLIIVTGSTGKPIFAATLRAPDPDELEILRAARGKGKGLAAALLSIVKACVTWSRDALDGAFARYPAIPLLVLMDDLYELGGSSADVKFRGRR